MEQWFWIINDILTQSKHEHTDTLETWYVHSDSAADCVWEIQTADKLNNVLSEPLSSVVENFPPIQEVSSLNVKFSYFSLYLLANIYPPSLSSSTYDPTIYTFLTWLEQCYHSSTYLAKLVLQLYTKNHGQAVSTPASYLGDHGLKS